MKVCPECGRRPSERHASSDDPVRHIALGGVSVDCCPGPTHDVADAAPALLEALEAEEECAACSGPVEKYMEMRERAQDLRIAALAAACPGEVQP